MNTFSAASCIRFGWEAFKKRAGFFIGITVIVGVVSWIVSLLGSSFRENWGLYVILYIASICISILLDMGLRSLMLKAHDSVESATIEDLWHPQQFWTYLGTIILMAIAIIVGLILLIIPGIYVALTLMFSKLIVIDKKLGPVEALRESARITKGHKWELLALALILIVLNIIGAILLLIGLLVTVPVTMLALVHAYKVLAQQAGPTPVS